jgi:hypothetical protein
MKRTSLHIGRCQDSDGYSDDEHSTRLHVPVCDTQCVGRMRGYLEGVDLDQSSKQKWVHLRHTIMMKNKVGVEDA